MTWLCNSLLYSSLLHHPPSHPPLPLHPYLLPYLSTLTFSLTSPPLPSPLPLHPYLLPYLSILNHHLPLPLPSLPPSFTLILPHFLPSTFCLSVSLPLQLLPPAAHFPLTPPATSSYPSHISLHFFIAIFSTTCMCGLPLVRKAVEFGS